MTTYPEIQGILLSAAKDIIETVVYVITVVVIPYGFVLLRAWVKAKKAELVAKTAAIENNDLREGLNDALERLDKTSETVVAELEATIKSYDAKGKVVNQEKLKTYANGRIVDRLLPTAKTVLVEQLGKDRFEKLISSKVEQKALDLKIKRKQAGC